MNTKKSNIPTMDEVKLLLNKYFEAIISPDEMVRLETLAAKVSSGEISYPDKKLENDLMLINSLCGFADATLTSVADYAPSGLEERLDNHISTLAKDSRRRRTRVILTRIMKYSAASAVIGLMGVGGYFHLSHQDSFSYPNELVADMRLSGEKETVASETIPPLVSVIPSPDDTQATPAAISDSRPLATGTLNHVISKHGPRKNATKSENITIVSATQETYLAQVNEALNPIPPFTTDAFIISEEAFRVMPIGITAYVETSEILIQPFFTLHQSVNDIYDTVDKVSEAFSGVSTALQAVGSSLALLSNPINPM